MIVKQTAKLRILSGATVLNGITREQAEQFLQGPLRQAFDLAIHEIETDPTYRGVTARWYGIPIQVDVL